jgi:site-specific DNA-methyltransferase (adenine-specific)
VDAVITDPPYGIDYQSARRTDREQWKPKIKNDLEPFVGWAEDIKRITKSVLYIFYRWDKQEPFRREMLSAGFEVKSQIIWDKVIHGMGDLKGEYAPQHENILFGTKDVFEFPGNRPRTIIRQRRVLPEDLLHPNEKPVPLICKLIEDSTHKGETVLDFCFGSCSTGVACVQTGRKFIGIEIDPKYFEIACKRIKDAQQQMRLPL